MNPLEAPNSPGTSDNEIYKEHHIVVNASRIGSGWTYTLEIQLPSGDWLQPISDDDHTYDSSGDALGVGMRAGREVVDRR